MRRPGLQACCETLINPKWGSREEPLAAAEMAHRLQSSGCSCRGPTFNTQNPAVPHKALELPSGESRALLWPPWVPDMSITPCTHAAKIPTHLSKREGTMLWISCWRCAVLLLISSLSFNHAVTCSHDGMFSALLFLRLGRFKCFHLYSVRESVWVNRLMPRNECEVKG